MPQCWGLSGRGIGGRKLCLGCREGGLLSDPPFTTAPLVPDTTRWRCGIGNNTQLLKVWVPLRVSKEGVGPSERGLKVTDPQRGGHGELIGKEGEATRWWEFWSCLGRGQG